MKIDFYFTHNGHSVHEGLSNKWDKEDYFITEDGEVWMNNRESYESQSSIVVLWDFITHCPNVSWRVVND